MESGVLYLAHNFCGDLIAALVDTPRSGRRVFDLATVTGVGVVGRRELDGVEQRWC